MTRSKPSTGSQADEASIQGNGSVKTGVSAKICREPRSMPDCRCLLLFLFRALRDLWGMGSGRLHRVLRGAMRA